MKMTPRGCDFFDVREPLPAEGHRAFEFERKTSPVECVQALRLAWVRKQIGPIASPDLIQWAPGLPKTRSGKIMRRILRKIAANEHSALGDTSTLADPAVVDDLVNNRMNKG